MICTVGTQFKTQDTPSNRHFGYAQSTTNFPSVLAVTLMSTRTHLISDAAFGPITQSEIQIPTPKGEIERGYGELKQYQLSNKPALRSLK